VWNFKRNPDRSRSGIDSGTWNLKVAESAAADRLPGPSYTDPAEWAVARLGLSFDETQMRVLRSTRARGLLNCTRQWGKSTVVAAKAIHHATHRPESLTLVVSPSTRQSAEFLRKAEGFARKLAVPVRRDIGNVVSLEFPNRSRIVGLPASETTVRGYSAVSLLLVDEAARVSDDIYLALRPMLAVSGGALWLMSTPFGRHGFFHDAWEHGGEEWERIRVTAPECPRISPEFLEEERATMGDWWFRQEYLCEFQDPVGAVFDRDLLEQALSDRFGPLEIR
jgi:hypothetical protein